MTLTWNDRLNIGTHRASIERRMDEHFAAWRYSWVAKRRRAEFWREHGRFCDRCGWIEGVSRGDRELEVHHVHYRDEVGYELDSTLRGLCDRCHARVHREHRAVYRNGRPYWSRDHWPYKHLEHVTDRCIRRAWWRRTLRGAK